MVRLYSLGNICLFYEQLDTFIRITQTFVLLFFLKKEQAIPAKVSEFCNKNPQLKSVRIQWLFGKSKVLHTKYTSSKITHHCKSISHHRYLVTENLLNCLLVGSNQITNFPHTCPVIHNIKRNETSNLTLEFCFHLFFKFLRIPFM